MNNVTQFGKETTIVKSLSELKAGIEHRVHDEFMGYYIEEAKKIEDFSNLMGEQMGVLPNGASIDKNAIGEFAAKVGVNLSELEIEVMEDDLKLTGEETKTVGIKKKETSNEVTESVIDSSPKVKELESIHVVPENEILGTKVETAIMRSPTEAELNGLTYNTYCVNGLSKSVIKKGTTFEFYHIEDDTDYILTVTETINAPQNYTVYIDAYFDYNTNEIIVKNVTQHLFFYFEEFEKHLKKFYTIEEEEMRYF